MSDTNQVEKKWFIYVKDHHEGPFSVLEIHEGIRSGKFSEPAYVWHQQLPDWMPTQELEEFKIQIPSFTKPKETEPSFQHKDRNLAHEPDQSEQEQFEEEHENLKNLNQDSMIEIKPLNQKNHQKKAPSPISVEENDHGRKLLQPEYVSKQDDHFNEEENAASSEYTSGGTLLPPRKKFLGDSQKKFVLAVFLVGLAGAALWSQPSTREPIEKILSIFSPFPTVTDLTTVDYDELKKIAQTHSNSGLLVDVAISTADPISPSFYVSSNLSSGAKFELIAVGIPETLLNVLQFEGHLNITTEKGIGKSQPLRYPDGKVIPRGEYKIYIVESAQSQPPEVLKQLGQILDSPKSIPNGVPTGRKIFFEKKIFWGERDQTYLSRLKEFHDKLIEKSRTEISELNQMTALIESQIQKTNSDFDRLKVQPLGPKQHLAWNTASQTWNQFANQLTTALSKMPSQENSEWVHSNLYQHIKKINFDLVQLRKLQDSFFIQKMPLLKINSEDLLWRSNLDKNVLELKSALNLLTQSPLSSVGLPNQVTVKYSENVSQNAAIPSEEKESEKKIEPPAKEISPQKMISPQPSPIFTGVAPKESNASKTLKTTPSLSMDDEEDESDDEDLSRNVKNTVKTTLKPALKSAVKAIDPSAIKPIVKPVPVSKPIKSVPKTTINESTDVNTFSIPNTIVVKPGATTKIPTHTTVDLNNKPILVVTPTPVPSPLLKRNIPVSPTTTAPLPQTIRAVPNLTPSGNIAPKANKPSSETNPSEDSMPL